MLNQGLKKVLLGTTMIAGLAVVVVSASPSYAQDSAAAGAPAQTAPDPAVVDQPDAPEEARNQQGEPATDDDAEVEAVVVTGSRIRRDPTNAPAPLIQLNREEILASGEPNVVDFLADIPALQGSQVPEDQTGGLNIGGLSLLDLRQLGSVRTLVLVDGRRHVPSAPGSLAVDVDTIPTLLVESTEIVTGGQSALYGADAVSGVVNFILRRNFEGLEVDAVVGQVNQEGQLNVHLQGLVGGNFLNDRLNVYAYGGYQETDEVRSSDIDFRREARVFLNNDTDPSPSQPDDQLDNILIRNARRIDFVRGGSLTLANQVRPSPASDPDIPFQACPTVVPTVFSPFSPNCFAVDPGVTFYFDGTGRARAPNFGTFRDQNGYDRVIAITDDPLALNTGTEFSGFSDLPQQDAFRFQTGFNFDITDSVQLYGEAKYVEENTSFESQPTFFRIGIAPVAAGQRPALFGTTSFNIGLDNAFLDPAVRQAILGNRRQIIDRQGRVTGTVADPRANLTLFATEANAETPGGGRNQQNQRELQRYVVGLRGDRDRVAFVNNFSWEAGYTYGKAENLNREGGALDVNRFQNQIDAVVDTEGRVNGQRGQIVCRVQLLAAQGIPVLDPQSNGRPGVQATGPNADRPFAANDPNIRDCVPARIFGTGGFSPEARAYSNAFITVTNTNEQQNFVGFASGELWDFWGAGPIGVAAGYEYREETTSGIGRSASTGGRLLFLNTGPDFPEVSYDANEVFGEIRVPLLRDLPFARRAEIGAAYRRSEYSTVGDVETYSFTGQYQPVRDVLFRGTYGKAVRIPNLAENFGPATQTFALLTDPCDVIQIRNTPDPTVRANRERNCAALGIPAGTSLVYTSSVQGRNAGNPDLSPEESQSYTASIVLTPRFIPRFSMVLDYYEIKIQDVISFVSAQTALNNCVSGASLNAQACATLTRDPANFRLTDFLQGALNFAALETKGIDFNARYSIDTADFLGRDLGRLDYSLRGNYLIRRENFTNISDPGDAEELDASIGFPRVRVLSTLTYSPLDTFSLTWDWDYQTSQELDSPSGRGTTDSDLLVQDPDNRLPEFLETGDYHQHDFTFRWEVREDVTLRGGVVNAFDADPAPVLGSVTSADNFDFFGRRFFVGLRYRR